jgi:hypothetical protein
MDAMARENQVLMKHQNTCLHSCVRHSHVKLLCVQAGIGKHGFAGMIVLVLCINNTWSPYMAQHAHTGAINQALMHSRTHVTPAPTSETTTWRLLALRTNGALSLLK